MSDEVGRQNRLCRRIGSARLAREGRPRNKPTQKEREDHEATHVPFRDWCAHCMMGRGRTHHHVAKQKSEDQSRRPIIAVNYYFMNMKSVPNAHRVPEESITCIAVKEDRHQNMMSSDA